jgi:hypothetical protein
MTLYRRLVFIHGFVDGSERYLCCWFPVAVRRWPMDFVLAIAALATVAAVLR